MYHSIVVHYLPKFVTQNVPHNTCCALWFVHWNYYAVCSWNEEIRLLIFTHIVVNNVPVEKTILLFSAGCECLSALSNWYTVI